MHVPWAGPRPLTSHSRAGWVFSPKQQELAHLVPGCRWEPEGLLESRVNRPASCFSAGGAPWRAPQRVSSRADPSCSWGDQLNITRLVGFLRLSVSLCSVPAASWGHIPHNLLTPTSMSHAVLGMGKAGDHKLRPLGVSLLLISMLFTIIILFSRHVEISTKFLISFLARKELKSEHPKGSQSLKQNY